MPQRQEHDFYPTPEPFVEAGLGLYKENPYRALDAGAGTGVYGKAIRTRFRDIFLVGVEVRDLPRPPEYDMWITQPFQTFTGMSSFDLIIGNPPFKHSEAFVRHAYSLLADGGVLIFMLNSTFPHSARRHKMLSCELKPKQIVYLSNRPSFSGDGKTAYKDYIYVVWQKGYGGDTVCKWLLVEDKTRTPSGMYEVDQPATQQELFVQDSQTSESAL